ncbi:MAG TPA: DUF342 domain-containing protein [Treponema sp.]|nr:DUF342 domain-containing protein [Treponema sp.]
MKEAKDANKDEQQDSAEQKLVLTVEHDDGNLVVSFSENELEARGDFSPATNNGQPLTLESVTNFLYKISVSYGQRWEEIEEAILRCNLNHHPVKNIVIARGDAPSSEIAEFFEMNPVLVKGGPIADESAQIDYRSYSPFVIVRKDQALAKMRKRKPGKPGKNVRGDEIPFPVIRPEGVTGGENTKTVDGLLVSEINGQLIKSGNVLNVQDFLVIKGSVGYSTGNIIFPGDVTIEGGVAAGFKIYTGGSLTIKQTLDVTDVVTKGDLSVAGGMIGRGDALVKSGGGIKTKFIENCRVAARKTITVDSDIINSSVFTLENIDMGDKGKIIGGDIYAVKGLKAAGIGKKTGKPTKIHCGVDFTVQQEKEKNNSQLHILAAKIAKLREYIADPALPEEKRAPMRELLGRLEQEQQAVSVKIAELLGRLNSDESAVVEITGEIASGTLIEICQTALYVPEPINKVRIKLDKASGRLVTEPL